MNRFFDFKYRKDAYRQFRERVQGVHVVFRDEVRFDYAIDGGQMFVNVFGDYDVPFWMQTSKVICIADFDVNDNSVALAAKSAMDDFICKIGAFREKNEKFLFEGEFVGPYKHKVFLFEHGVPNIVIDDYGVRVDIYVAHQIGVASWPA